MSVPLPSRSPRVGDVVVWLVPCAGLLHPVVCNSALSPDHPCRIVVSRVGCKYAFAPASGGDVRMSLDSAFPIEEAKAYYRAALEHYSRGGDAARVEALVSGL